MSDSRTMVYEDPVDCNGAFEIAAGFWKADIVYALLVEDDDVDAKLVELYAAGLRKPRVIIERAVCVSEARRLLAEWSFDVCILDFWLGCESSLRLLADVNGLNVVPPTIVLTSLSTPDIHRMCDRGGASSFLGKDGLTQASLQAAIVEAVRTGATNRALPATHEDATVRLLARLLAVATTAQTGERAASADWFPEHALLQGQLVNLLDMTETVRFGLFEKVAAKAWPAVPTSAGAWIGDVGSVIAGAIEVSRGVFNERGQTVSLHRPEETIAVSCDPASFLFLMFELVARASHQSASNSRIRIWLRGEDDVLRIGLVSDRPANVNASALALGPLFAQILTGQDGSLTQAFGHDGRLHLEAGFKVRMAAGAEAGLVSLEELVTGLPPDTGYHHSYDAG